MSKNTQESKPDTVAILQRAKDKKLELEAELKLLLKGEVLDLSEQFGVSFDDNEVSGLDKAIKNLGTPVTVIKKQEDTAKEAPLNPEEALESSMQDSLKRLEDVSGQAVDFGEKTPEESKELLENLVREQERFCVSMKIARIAQTQLMIDSCESISEIEQSGGNPAEIAQHTESLKRNLGRLDKMPSSADLEMQNKSLSKLVDLFRFITPTNDVEADRSSDSMTKSHMQANISMANLISQAFAVSVQPFTKFLKRQNQTSPDSLKTVEDLSDEVFEIAIREDQRLFNKKLGVAQKNLDSENNEIKSKENEIKSKEKEIGFKKEQIIKQKEIDVAGKKAEELIELKKELIGLKIKPKESRKESIGSIKESIGSRKESIGSIKESIGSRKEEIKSEKEKIDKEKEIYEKEEKEGELRKKEIELKKKEIEKEIGPKNEEVESKIKKIGVKNKDIEEIVKSKEAKNKEVKLRNESVESKNNEISEEKNKKPLLSFGRSALKVLSGGRFGKSPLEKELTELESGLPKLQKELSTFVEDLSSSEKELTELESGLPKLQKELSTLVEDLSKLEEESSELEAKSSNRKSELSNLEVELSNLEEESFKLEVELSNLEEESFKLEEQSSNLDAELPKLEEELTELNNDLARLDSREENSKPEAEVSNPEEELAELENELSELENELSELNTSLSGRKAGVTELESEIAELKATIAKNNDYLNSKDSKGKKSKTLDGRLAEFQPKTVEKPKEVDLKDLIAAAKTFADSKEKEDAVVRAVQSERKDKEKSAAQESGLVDALTKSFEKGFVLAEAIESGEVQAKQSDTALVLSLAKSTLANALPFPGAGIAVNVLFSVAEFANQAKEEAQNRNVAGFAQSSSESEEVKGLRQQTVAKIAKKIHDIYSIKTDDKSPLDALKPSGTEKFANFLVGEVIDQIANFKVEQDEIKDLGLDRDKLIKSEEYRGQIAEKYADDVAKISKDYGFIPPDINNLGSDNGGALDKLIERIDCKIYTEYMTDRLVNAVIEARETGTMSKLTEARNKIRFEKEDLTDPVEGQTLTAQGLVKRVGIVTLDGNRYVSNERDKDVQGLGSKYGFRKATKDEEEYYKKTLNISGYSKYVPIQERLTSEKEKFIESLTLEDFANNIDRFNKKKQIVDDFFEDYHEAKLKDSSVTLPKFLADNPLIKNSDQERNAELNASLKELKDTSKLAESIKPENAPDQKDFTAKRLLAIDALKESGMSIKEVDELLTSVMGSYKKWKEEEGNKKLGPKDFFKSDSSPIEGGKRTGAISLFGAKIFRGNANEDREYFNKFLKTPLIELLKSSDKMANPVTTLAEAQELVFGAISRGVDITEQLSAVSGQAQELVKEISKASGLDISGQLSEVSGQAEELINPIAEKVKESIASALEGAIDKTFEALLGESETQNLANEVRKAIIKASSEAIEGSEESEEVKKSLIEKVTESLTKALPEDFAIDTREAAMNAAMSAYNEVFDKFVKDSKKAAEQLDGNPTGKGPDKIAGALSPRESSYEKSNKKDFDNKTVSAIDALIKFNLRSKNVKEANQSAEDAVKEANQSVKDAVEEANQSAKKAVEKVLKNYNEWKEEEGNKKSDLEDFFKSNKSPIEDGKRTGTFFGAKIFRGKADEDRKYFNEFLKKPLIELLKSSEKMANPGTTRNILRKDESKDESFGIEPSSINEGKIKQPESVGLVSAKGAELSRALKQFPTLAGAQELVSRTISRASSGADITEQLSEVFVQSEELINSSAEKVKESVVSVSEGAIDKLVKDSKKAAEQLDGNYTGKWPDKIAGVSSPRESFYEKSKNSAEPYIKYYEAKKKSCEGITHSNLKDGIQLSDGEDATKKINALLNNFVSIYHEQVMRGANKPDLDKFASDNLPVNKENTLVVKQVKDLAESYSQMRLAEAILIKTAVEERILKGPSAKESLLELLTLEDLGGDKTRFEDKEKEVDKLLEDFQDAKKKNEALIDTEKKSGTYLYSTKKLEFNDFFENSPFIPKKGTSSIKKERKVNTTDRDRFDLIKEAFRVVIDVPSITKEEVQTVESAEGVSSGDKIKKIEKNPKELDELRKFDIQDGSEGILNTINQPESVDLAIATRAKLSRTLKQISTLAGAQELVFSTISRASGVDINEQLSEVSGLAQELFVSKISGATGLDISGQSSEVSDQAEELINSIAEKVKESVASVSGGVIDKLLEESEGESKIQNLADRVREAIIKTSSEAIEGSVGSEELRKSLIEQVKESLTKALPEDLVIDTKEDAMRAYNEAVDKFVEDSKEAAKEVSNKAVEDSKKAVKEAADKAVENISKKTAEKLDGKPIGKEPDKIAGVLSRESFLEILTLEDFGENSGKYDKRRDIVDNFLQSFRNQPKSIIAGPKGLRDFFKQNPFIEDIGVAKKIMGVTANDPARIRFNEIAEALKKVVDTEDFDAKKSLAMEDFTEKKSKIDSLDPKEVNLRKNWKGLLKENVVESLLTSYKAWKNINVSKTHDDFLKSDESPINNGKNLKTGSYFSPKKTKTPDADRGRFNKLLKEPLIDLLKSYDTMVSDYKIEHDILVSKPTIDPNSQSKPNAPDQEEAKKEAQKVVKELLGNVSVDTNSGKDSKMPLVLDKPGHGVNNGRGG